LIWKMLGQLHEEEEVCCICKSDLSKAYIEKPEQLSLVYHLTDRSTGRYILHSYTILGLTVLGRCELVHPLGLGYETTLARD
jgi:hypothetical protein